MCLHSKKHAHAFSWQVKPPPPPASSSPSHAIHLPPFPDTCTPGLSSPADLPPLTCKLPLPSQTPQNPSYNPPDDAQAMFLQDKLNETFVPAVKGLVCKRLMLKENQLSTKGVDKAVLVLL